MAIKELRIIEALIVFFLAMPLLRPFFRAMLPLDGLAWLPFVALGFLAGMIPAFGFRPECLPITAYAFVFCIAHLLNVLFFTGKISYSREYGSRRTAGRRLLTVFTFILLVAVSLPMFVFYPKVLSDLSITENGTEKILKITAVAPGTGEYFLRIYPTKTVEINSEKTQFSVNPLIMIIPPERGSAASVDLVCKRLREKGYNVITYSRKGLDTSVIDEKGKKRFISPKKMLLYRRIYTKAGKFVTENQKGKTLEKERRRDIEFLLSYLPSLQAEIYGYGSEKKLPVFHLEIPVILTGYGAGGSALAYLAGENSFISHYGNFYVLGVTAIESLLWSAYNPVPEKNTQVFDSKKKFPQIMADLINRLYNMKRQRVERSGSLPVLDLFEGNFDSGGSRQRVPVLYLISGRALSSVPGTGTARQSYQAVFDVLDSGNGPVAIAAVESSGPLDYQDFPLTHPVYSFLYPGQKNVSLNEDPVGGTAAIINNYAVFLLEHYEKQREYQYLEKYPRADEDFIIYIPPRSPINSGLFIQTKGLHGFQL